MTLSTPPPRLMLLYDAVDTEEGGKIVWGEVKQAS
jgi:hypothetical protein